MTPKNRPRAASRSGKFRLNADVHEDAVELLDRVTAQLPLLTRHRTTSIAVRLGLALLDGDLARLEAEVRADQARDLALKEQQ